jgi:rubredoxin
MKCTLCGHEFDEETAQATCKGCIAAKGCELVKCPNCGMDSPKTPKWIEKLTTWMKRKDRKT